MAAIRAVVVEPAAPGHLILGGVGAPRPADTDALVRVKAISLNPGELRPVTTADAGYRPGWDFAGIVEQAAKGGNGPRQGARVVGMLSGAAWAELLAVPVSFLAELPDEVYFAEAATLPVAGLTALYTLEKGGSVLERQVLVTGASGACGHFAVQLARRAGARVAAQVRQLARRDVAAEAGAQEIVISEDGLAAAKFGPYDLVIESVGGRVLTNVLTMLAPDGLCVTYGATADTNVSFDLRRFYLIGGARLYGFIIFHELRRKPAGQGLARLVPMVAAGELKPLIGLEASWKEVGAVAQKFMERQFAGKAVLHVED